MKTRHGSYVQIDGESYHLTWVSPSTMEQISGLSPRLNLLRRATVSLIRAAVHILSINEDNQAKRSEFQHIVVANFREIAQGMSNAMIHLATGSLADSLTLLRPALEYMLDNAYLELYPEAVGSYHVEVIKHNASLVEGRPIARNPKDQMRFMNASKMFRQVDVHEDASADHRKMVERWYLLSSVVEHTSPERKNLSLRRPTDWENTINEFEIATFLALNQICVVDDDLADVIEQDGELRTELDETRLALLAAMAPSSDHPSVQGPETD